MVAFPTWTGNEFQTDGSEGENAESPFILHLQSGSCGRRVSVLGWSGREGEYSCRGPVKFAGVGEVMALRQGRAFTGTSSFGCDVYTQRCSGYRKGCTVGTLLGV